MNGAVEWRFCLKDFLSGIGMDKKYTQHETKKLAPAASVAFYSESLMDQFMRWIFG